jgi:hypothetical protein
MPAPTVALMLGLALAATALGAVPALAAPGDIAWSRVFERASVGTDAYVALVASSAGSVYAVGYSQLSPKSGSDVLIDKYGLDGRRLWHRDWTYPGVSSDGAADAACDHRGDLVLVGHSAKAALVMKYSPRGRLIWVGRTDGAGPSAAKAVALDPQGDIFVAGETTGADHRHRYYLVKYGRDGGRLWTATHGSGTGDSAAADVAVDGSGNAYVTGAFAVDPEHGSCTTVKYSPSGRRLWSRDFADAVDEAAAGRAVAFRGGTVFVMGDRDDPVTGVDGFLLAYAPDGSVRYASGYSSSSRSPSGSFEALAVDDARFAYVTGSYDAGSTREQMTLCFAPDGSLKWSLEAAGVPAQGSAICLDGNGDVLTVAGGGGTNATSLTSAGGIRWLRRWAPTAYTVHVPQVAAAVAGKAIYAAGSVQVRTNGSAAFVIRFRP